MPGYKDQEIAVKTELAGNGAAGFAGNVLIGGVIGMGTDVATGATQDHKPNPVHATMEKGTAHEPAKPVRHHKTSKSAPVS